MPKKILLVDDEPPIIEMYGQKLARGGYQVIPARNGEEALKLAQTQQPDLILLDIIMPKFNGLDVLQTLKADSRTEKIPVILLSNIPKYTSQAKGQALGALDYFFKVDTVPADLLSLVNQRLGN